MRDNMTPNEFKAELLVGVDSFARNMNNLIDQGNSKLQNRDFIQWFEHFGHWMEIGTSMENEYWGTPGNDDEVK